MPEQKLGKTAAKLKKNFLPDKNKQGLIPSTGENAAFRQDP